MTATFLARIEINADGVAFIEGTRTKVAEVVMDRQAHGWSPEEIHFQHPHLSMAQIHVALTYYYEHKIEIDEWILNDAAEADRMTLQLSDPDFRVRLLGPTKLYSLRAAIDEGDASGVAADDPFQRIRLAVTNARKMV